METSKLVGLLTDRYNDLKIGSDRKRSIKWPSGISVAASIDTITIAISNESLNKNMQDNSSAFEAWILALKELVYPEYLFTIKLESSPSIIGQHYQRFLVRLWMFSNLFGSWFVLSPDVKDQIYCKSRYLEYRGKLLCNTGQGGGRSIGVHNELNELEHQTEGQLEFRLCKDGKDHKCLEKAFKTKPVFRQFPVGIFVNKVTAKDENQLFPGKKACIDLVAESDDGTEFWIFELKKHSNNPFGILSELLFYTALVRDMVAGNISAQRVPEKDCYNPANLKGKKHINACFLAPDFHPLLLDSIVLRLNEAFELLQKKDQLCSVVFHKALLEQNSTDSIDIKRVFPHNVP